MNKMTVLQSGLRWVWISLLVIILDQISKWFAIQHLVFAEPLAVLPFFNLILLHNTGSAFNFLAQTSWAFEFFASFAIIISVLILTWLKRISYQQTWLSVALTFILGGALGNLIDRIHHGFVIDFIQLYYQKWYWPAFNIADTAITIGAIMLLVDVLFKKEPKNII